MQITGQALPLLYGSQRLCLFVKPGVLHSHRRLVGKTQHQFSVAGCIIVVWFVVLEGHDAYNLVLDGKRNCQPGPSLVVDRLEMFAGHLSQIVSQGGIISRVTDDDRLLIDQ